MIKGLKEYLEGDWLFNGEADLLSSLSKFDISIGNVEILEHERSGGDDYELVLSIDGRLHLLRSTDHLDGYSLLMLDSDFDLKSEEWKYFWDTSDKDYLSIRPLAFVPVKGMLQAERDDDRYYFREINSRYMHALVQIASYERIPMVELLKQYPYSV